ncbi:uncharacterized protein LOC114544917 isoform X1 [Dendronephthya gigantea]|uniref:uncharacterized protein LOC114544917 isoform X1 n=1 Tax=Dendronephthya gigantea TaxID=151771 RepID=UPI00106B540E|nr:uncharacterized protein LOC114544917 isoform X1 [Dendronephthya gigantea]
MGPSVLQCTSLPVKKPRKKANFEARINECVIEERMRQQRAIIKRSTASEALPRKVAESVTNENCSPRNILRNGATLLKKQEILGLAYRNKHILRRVPFSLTTVDLSRTLMNL